jgi:hypothetical protein
MTGKTAIALSSVSELPLTRMDDIYQLEQQELLLVDAIITHSFGNRRIRFPSTK